MAITIMLPGNTPSLKNSKRVVRAGDKLRLIPSEAYEKWANKIREELIQSKLRGHPWRYPVRIDFHFYRKDRSRFDLANICQGPLDLLVEMGILEDDDMNHVVPGSWAWEVDHKTPRVELRITEL